MTEYLIRRVLLIVPVLLLISVLAFIVMEAPPGDFVTSYMMRQAEQGALFDGAGVEEGLRAMWGLDKPWYVRYLRWLGNLLRGNLGYSLSWQAPVHEIIASRFVLSMTVALAATVLVWVVAFPIGIYSATRQYSLSDNAVTFVGFLGLSIPNFLLALIMMYLANRFLNVSIGGLFSQKYVTADWSWGKLIDFLGHLWVPIIVIGVAGTAGLIRILRANLLDEISKSYVEMARAKGLRETVLIMKYPVRIAINPFISSIGWVLPGMISGDVIVSVVLGLPTAGPMFLQALRQQDMMLAGALHHAGLGVHGGRDPAVGHSVGGGGSPHQVPLAWQPTWRPTNRGPRHAPASRSGGWCGASSARAGWRSPALSPSSSATPWPPSPSSARPTIRASATWTTRPRRPCGCACSPTDGCSGRSCTA